MLLPILLLTLAQQQSPCDPHVPPVEGPYGYKVRMGPLRCEGFHEVKVASGTPIFLAQLVEAYAPYDAASPEPITVRWRSPSPSATIRLQATSIPGRLDAAYRMDATVQGGDASFEWPTDFLRVRGIALDALGIRAWVLADVAGTERVVHLALDVYQGERPDADKQITLEILTRMTITDALLSVTRVGANDLTIDVKPLRGGTHAAQSLVSFALPPLPEGIYRADFSAESIQPSAGQEPLSLRFWFYHPGD